jgi:hypothetical protein
MSSTRRKENEVNILAMLDRHEAAGIPQRILRGLRGLPAAAWYGAAGVLVCVLVGVLAWLARDSDPSTSADTALAGAVAVKPAEPIAAAPPELASASLVVPDALPDPDPVPAAGAAIVDVAPAPAAAPDASEAPVHALPPPHAGRMAPHEFAREPQRLAAHAATGKSALRTAADKAPATGSRPALAHGEPRRRHSASLPKAAPEPVDTDVALISAIIQHANQRQEAEDAARKP